MLRPTPATPAAGQESVWDYPRPPRVEPSGALIEIVLGGVVIARTGESVRVLETSHPPTHYLPVGCFRPGVLVPATGQSWCEWKGRASYFDLVVGSRRAHGAAWTYREPAPGFALIAGAVAVMPGLVDRCTLDGEVVRPQDGGFYGGWVTSRVSGPFKGGPGSSFW